mmetsp:Transcript_85774/g.195532  ORF Transcript_85774/g.195532 Transcript_85774/m.195532 type:complete len:122 (+) Transcript_85774:68-433(+)
MSSLSSSSTSSLARRRPRSAPMRRRASSSTVTLSSDSNYYHRPRSAWRDSVRSAAASEIARLMTPGNTDSERWRYVVATLPPYACAAGPDVGISEAADSQWQTVTASRRSYSYGKGRRRRM